MQTEIEVVITDENGVEVFRATVTPEADGSWSIPAADLPEFDEEMDYTATATAKDAAGNEAEATDVDAYDLLPTVDVDLEVDPGAEKLEGNSTNATEIEVVITDENGVEVFRATVTPEADGSWSIPAADLPEFDEEMDYTATATAKDAAGNEAEATDVDAYDLLPTVDVDLEVDPGAEKLEGNSTNATEIEVVITDENGVEVFRATVTPEADGSWSIPAADLPEFDEEMDYTATATAKDAAGNEAEATDVDAYDLLPTISVEDNSFDEDFIQNIGNFTNPDGDNALNQASDTGAINASNATSVVFADNQTTSLTSNGEAIKLTTSADGKTIEGTTVSGTPVFIAVINAQGSSYEFTLQGKVDHPVQDSEDEVSLPLTIEASDGTTTVTDDLDITIGDDVPCAHDTSIEIDLNPDPVNLVFTLDISGSMGKDVDGTDQDRLEIAIDAINNLVSEYEGLGHDVNIQINTFSTSATGNTAWMNSSELSNFLDDLNHKGWTNYEDALEVTQESYENSTVPEGTTYAYFLSDGNPTVEINDGSSDNTGTRDDGSIYSKDGEYIDEAREAAWNKFISDNNIEEVYAVGIGTDVSTEYLSQVSSNVIEVDDPSELSATLQQTIVYETGELDFCFGADGAADGSGPKEDGGKLPFTWETPTATNAVGQAIAIVWAVSADGKTLEGTDSNGDTVIKLEAKDIFSDNPTYVITELDKDSGIADLTVPYTVTDADGDSVTADLNVDVSVATGCTYKSNLVGYWSMGESSGTELDDMAPIDNDATLYGGYILGEENEINGTDTATHFWKSGKGWGEIDHHQNYELENGTISFWMKETGHIGDNIGVLSKDTDSTDGLKIVTMNANSNDWDKPNSDGYIKVSLNGHTLESDPDSIQLNEWSQVTLSFGDGGMKLYIDGVLADSNDYTGGLENNYDPMTLAGNLDNGKYFSGSLDELAIFDRELTPNEIKTYTENSQYCQKESTDPIPTTVLVENNEVIFEDGFEDCNSNGWCMIQVGGDADCNDVRVFADKDGDGDKELKLADGSTYQGFAAQTIAAATALTSYAISADIDTSACGDNDHNNDAVGLVFGYEDNDNYYKVIWNDFSDNYSNNDTYRDFSIIKVENGDECELSKVDELDIYGNYGHTFNLNVEVDDAGIHAYINGDLIVEALGEQPAMETFGLWTDDNDAGVTYDNVKVESTVKASYDLDDSSDIDLVELYNQGARGADAVSLEGNNTNDITKIDLNEVVDLTDDDNELKIFGDDGDKVVLDEDSTWTNQGKETIDGDTFNVYQGTNGNSNIKILIDEDVSIDSDL